MFLSHFVLIAYGLAITGAAVSLPTSHVEHERQDHINSAWIRRSPVSGGTKTIFRIGLTQRNLHKGDELLNEVSDPSSPKYGKYYSPEEVAVLFAPSTETINAVKQWLSAEGFPVERTRLSSTAQWLHLNTTFGELESLLHTKYHHFENIDNGMFDVACEKYHLPRHLARHIDFVTPGINLRIPSTREASSLSKRSFSPKSVNSPRSRPMPILDKDLKAMSPSEQCGHAITPDCIKLLYNITDTYKSFAGNQLGLFESDDKFDQLDLNKFFTKFALDIPNGTHPVIRSIDGGKAIAKGFRDLGAETGLDLMMSYPLLGPKDIVDFITDDGKSKPNGGFYSGLGLNDFLDAVDGSYCNYTAFGFSGKPVRGVDEPFPDKRKGGFKGQRECGIYAPTNVISISYGYGESYVPMNYQRRQCNEWMKLVLMGKTVVASSGDFGVAALHTLSGEQGCLGKNQDTIFQPQYPATCPYILTVGATYLPKGANVNSDAEVASVDFGSGGGFSNIYPIPSYQKTQVKGYFANHAPKYPYYESTYNRSFGANGGIYNRAGRGYPDVSAVGQNIFTFLEGKPQLGGGTSASTPLWASLLTRINAARLAAGKPTVGYVHPILYQNPQVFHDITKGNNPGCNTKGFSASKGWDPVTGLGTPDYPKLLELFMNTPTHKSQKQTA